MNILQVNAATSWGGVEHHMILLSRGLRKQEHHVVIACSPNSPLIGVAGRERIPVVPVQMRGQLDLRAVMKLRGLIRQLRIDIVNTHGPLAHTLTWLASMGLNVRIVATRHVTFPLRRHPFRKMKWVHGVNRMIAVCGAVVDSLVASKIPPELITVIYCPLDSDRFHSGISGKKVREEFGLGLHTPVVGQVAELRSWKGFDDFIRAAELILKEMPDSHFLIVGRKTSLYDELVRLAQDLGVMDRIHFTGFRSDIEKCYAAMTVCVNSSTRGEAAPYALKEPLAMGVPVVATRIGGNAEVVSQDQTGFLVPPRNPRVMADAVLRLLKDRDLRERMGHEGQQDVKKRFSLDAAVARTEAVYQDALKED